jgi:hypothetical protein
MAPLIALVGVSLFVLAACGESPAVRDRDEEPTVYEAEAFVLDDLGREPVLCLGSVADSVPPQCEGIALSGWDWDSVDGEDVASGSTWRTFHVTGTYDGTTFTVSGAGPSVPQPSDSDPRTPPCPEPAGGWSSTDLSIAGEDDMIAASHAAEQEGDFSGFWINYVEQPVGEVKFEPGSIVVTAAFTGELERHIREIRDVWGGPLCVVELRQTYADLRRIQRELGEGAATELGLEATWSGVDIQENVVDLGVVVADGVAARAMDERYDETVELHPALVPADGEA